VGVIVFPAVQKQDPLDLKTDVDRPMIATTTLTAEIPIMVIVMTLEPNTHAMSEIVSATAGVRRKVRLAMVMNATNMIRVQAEIRAHNYAVSGMIVIHAIVELSTTTVVANPENPCLLYLRSRAIQPAWIGEERSMLHPRTSVLHRHILTGLPTFNAARVTVDPDLSEARALPHPPDATSDFRVRIANYAKSLIHLTHGARLWKTDIGLDMMMYMDLVFLVTSSRLSPRIHRASVFARASDRAVGHLATKAVAVAPMRIGRRKNLVMGV
jgi:hypothetical protein